MDILADKYIMSLYQDLEDEVIADIARRVKKTGRYTETAELMAKSMHEQGFSPAKIQAEVMKRLRSDKEYQMAVAENTKAYKQEIQDIIDKTVKEAKKAGDVIIGEAGNMSWNNDLSMWEEHGEDLSKPNNMSQLISAASVQTNMALKNLTKTMGFRNTTLGTTGVLNAYQRELDLALIKVSTGTFSFDQAVNECVHRLAQSGLRSIDYASGRTYQIDTAVRMAVRTGMSQLAGKVMEENLKSSGQDLVITSQHMGSRPEHAPWQNKVFSYSGTSKKYPDFFEETRYGEVDGLKGVNCTHDFYPFWEGASVIPDDISEPDPVEIDGKEYDYYQATQKQRQMERNIRAIKREIEAQKKLGGPTTELNSMLKAKTNEYQRFSRKAGLKPKENRLRVEKGTSALSKTNVVRKTVINAPVIKDKKIRKAYDSFGSKLLNSKGNEKLVNNMIMYQETTDVVYDSALKIPFAYRPYEDRIVYNPKAPNFDLYDLDYAQSHELSHRMDIKEYHSWDNKEFQNAIAIAQKQAYDNVDEITKLLDNDDLMNDVALSDVLSAVTDGKLNDMLIAGHEEEYWKLSTMKSMEIFANLCSIEINDYTSKAAIKKLFPELWNAFERML